jgi:hypothetical protein
MITDEADRQLSKTVSVSALHNLVANGL